jgi:restriction system protein
LSKKSPLEDIIEISFKNPIFGIVISLLFAVLGFYLSNKQYTTSPVGASSLGIGHLFSTACYGLSALALIFSAVGFIVMSYKKRNQKSYFETRTKLDDIKNLSWKEFEKFVGSLFEKLGYSVEVIGGLNDGGIDLIIRKDNKTSLVQCKNFRVSKVNLSMVRDFYGAMNANLNYQVGYFITTGIFTLDAKHFAEDKPIELIDGARLMDYVNMVSLEKAPQRNTAQTAKPTDVPVCPNCGSSMVMRTAKKGTMAGSNFWGCSTYPNCNAIKNINL